MSTELVPANEMQEKIKRNTLNGWEDLEPKRKAFALRYVVDYNHRQAAEDAGFSANAGISLVREPLLSAFISEIQHQAQITNLITEDFVRTQWMNMIPLLMGDVQMPMGVDRDGDQVYGQKFYPAELNNVLKEMAKTTKIYDEGSGQGGNVNVQINVAGLIGETDGVIIDHE